MSYPNAETLTNSYAATTWIIKRQAEGLSHADSLLQPPFRGNCFNWVVGHILTSRHETLALLGERPLWDEATLARYRTGSNPLTDPAEARPLEQLLADVDETQARIAAALARHSPEALGQVVKTRRGERPIAVHINGLHWHETYHTGQLELLRQLAGKDDQVI